MDLNLDGLLKSLSGGSGLGWGSMWIPIAMTLASGFGVFVLFRIGAFFVGRLTYAMLTGRVVPELADFVSRSARTVMNVIGLISALGTMGVNVMALIAALGLASLAIGFALRDLVANVVSGLMILIYQPFTIDDVISINELHGKVYSIDMRYTQLQSAGERILIPNSQIFSNAVIVVRSGP